MDGKFYKVNDYNWVLSSEKQKAHNHLRELINTSFEGSGLLFCLLEKVTIKNQTGIGSIIIFSHLLDDEEKNIYETYKRVVKEVQSIKKLNPTEYKEWYQPQRSYFFIDKNEEADFSVFEDYEFNWGDDWKPGNDEERNYRVNELKSNLSSQKILEYLDFYAEKLKAELNLSAYPHFAIVIRPVSVINKSTGQTYPLGNLFLHFATTEKKEETFYVELINKFLLAWFRSQGGLLVEEIQKDLKDKIDLKSKDHLPKLSHKGENRLSEILNDGNSKLIDFFDKHHNSSAHHAEFNERATKIKEKTIRYLLHKYGLIDADKEPTLGELDDLKQKDIAALKDLHDDFDLFIDILLRRKVFGISLFLFNHDLRKIHSFMTNGDLNSESKVDANSIYHYFWINLILSIGKSSGESYDKKRNDLKSDKTRKRVLAQFIAREKKYFRSCIEYAESLLNDEQKEKFRKLVFAELK